MKWLFASSAATSLLAFSWFVPVAWIFNSWIFESDVFMTRDRCGPGWSDGLKAIYIASSLAVAVSYLAIPAMLLALYRSKRQELPSPWLLVTFAAFLALSATTYLSDVTVFWWAPYRLYTLLRVLTGVVSLAAASVMPFVVKTLVKLPSREYVHALNNQLQARVWETELMRREAMERERVTALANKILKDELAALRARLNDRLYYHDRGAILSDIERITSLIPQPEATGGIITRG